MIETPSQTDETAHDTDLRLWSLTPEQLVERYWASYGVQMVSLGDSSKSISRHAELYLLMPPSVLAIFSLRPIIQLLTDLDALLVRIRVSDQHDSSYSEFLEADELGRFERFSRAYRSGSRKNHIRCAITTEREIAGNWKMMNADMPTAWRMLRHMVRGGDASVSTTAHGSFGDILDREALQRVLLELMRLWRNPSSTVSGISGRSSSWVHESSSLGKDARLVGDLWIGSGYQLRDREVVVGPAVLWDRLAVESPDDREVDWLDLEPDRSRPAEVTRTTPYVTSGGKRVFDLVFALIAILFCLPLLPIVALLIWLEDRGPVFFVHRREGIGGREFGCLKFRTMRRDADRIKTTLAASNQADGPQFYIADDPRITRIGRVLRSLQIDELPQLVNVVLGHMSIVGPRPSPYTENQYCPGWREARLSIRPGITGLWQVRRTRAEGSDFQEWIRYDILYVENASWGLDLRIVFETLVIITRPILRR